MRITDLFGPLRSDSFVVTAHCMKRMIERGIALSEVKDAILCGEIIEDYPDAYPYPCCLILGNRLHVVAGLGEGVLWLVTVYKPDSAQWEDDLKTRKERHS